MNGALTAPRPPLVSTLLQGVVREAATVASNNLMAMMEQKELADRVGLLEKSVSKCKDEIDFREEVTNHLENRLDSLEERLNIAATDHIVYRFEWLEKAFAALPFGQSKARVGMLGARSGNPREDQVAPGLHSLVWDVGDTSHEAAGAENVDFEELREGIDVVEKCFDSQFDKIFEGLMDERERHEKAMTLAESQRDQAKVEREGLRADVDAVKQSLKRLEQRLDEMEHAGLGAQVSSVDQRLKDHYNKEIQTRIPALERGLESVREGCPGRDSFQNLSSEVRSIKDDIAELSGGLGDLPLDHDMLDRRLKARHQNQTRTLEDLQTILSQAKQKHEQDLEAKVKMLQNDISDREQANAKTVENMRREHASEMAKVREEMASLQKMTADMVGTQRTMTTKIAALRKEMSADTGKENRHGLRLLEILQPTMVEQHCTQLQQPEQTTEKGNTPMRHLFTKCLQFRETPTGRSSPGGLGKIRELTRHQPPHQTPASAPSQQRIARSRLPALLSTSARRKSRSGTCGMSHRPQNPNWACFLP